jgi:protein-disulfide isomerase
MKNIKDEKYFPAYIIGISILISAILISASVFYNSRIIIAKLGGEGSDVAQAAQGDQNTKVTVKARSDSPMLGNKNAKITMYEFSDFQCPYSKAYFDSTFSQIKKEYVDTGKVKIVYRNLPLPFHVNAQKAAEAGECANRQGKFWEYHDLLFTKAKSDGTGLDTASLKSYASQVGLDNSKFNQCLDNGETTDVIKKDLADAQSAGVTGTPTFVINGQKVVGAQPISNFESIINGIK